MYSLMIYSLKADAREKISDEIKTTRKEYMKVTVYDNPFSAMAGSVIDGGYDIAIFHISMKSEIQLARRLKFYNNKTSIIYLSGNANLLHEMTQGEPFTSLVGDNEFERFSEALEDAFSRACMEKQNFFRYHRDRRNYMVDLNDIMYFYSEHKKVYMVHEHMGEDYFYQKLDKVEEIVVNKTNTFRRVSKSYLINVTHIKKSTDDEVTMNDGTYIKVTEKYKNSAIKW